MFGGERLKTEEEYHAMAILLGYIYVELYHMFDTYPNDVGKHKWVDPDTLEVIPLTSIHNRRHRC